MDHEEHSLSVKDIGEIPTQAGVYIFHGVRTESAAERVLYVGKAKNLRSRVRQYFWGDSDRRPFIRFIREKVETIHYIAVPNEQDALLLENELIKKFHPPYNISLKDDKRYLSLRLDLRHEWPRIEVTRKIKRDGAVYFGPFSSAARLRETLDFLQKLFPMRTCTDHILYNRSRPCIEYELKRCTAPCVKYIQPEDYKKIVQGAVLFLQGKGQELQGQLEVQMQKLSEEERFEEAAKIRDRLQSIKATTQGQSVIGLKQFQQGIDQDAVGIAEGNGRVLILIVFVRNGTVFDQRRFDFSNVKLDVESLMIEFLNRYYNSEVYLPDEILVPFEINPEDLDVNTRVILPRSDEKKGFLTLAQQNAKIYFDAFEQKLRGLGQSLTALEQKLSLTKFPQVIDCVDISHHQGMETVASVVRFVDGVPFKNGYRRIKLASDRVDDFGCMQEALTRRYKGLEDLPHLLVIDGGRGQLSSAQEILRQHDLLEYVDIVALAKARDEEGIDPLNPKNRERVFKPQQKNPILLKEDSPEELLIRYLRDEAHRFAIRYHRDRKIKNISLSILDSVPGMTERIKLKLLRRFGDIESICGATDVDLLSEIPNKMLEPLRATLKQSQQFEEEIEDTSD